MSKRKGSQCPSCSKYTMEYKNGVWKCRTCEALAWTPFDRPSADTKRKGHECFNCSNQTLHPIGDVLSTRVWKCSICATTVVEQAQN